MYKHIRFLAPAFAIAASAGLLLAGMPVLVIGNAEASGAARAAGAVLTLKPAGCLPASANVSGAAIGMVQGERRSIPLKLTRLPETGVYALTQQWPAEGKWVLQLTATDGLRTVTALVPAGPNGVERQNAKFFPRQITSGEADAMLNGPAPAVARK